MNSSRSNEFGLKYVNTGNNLENISFLLGEERELFLKFPWWKNGGEKSENMNLSVAL